MLLPKMSGVMRMYEKLSSLKKRLQQMKQNRTTRQNGQTFHFSPFSKKQKQVLTWWCKESPVHDKDGIIADGAIRSGKTVSMSLSFVMWAMSGFAGQNFAMCGKTIGSFRRNVLFWLKLMLRSRGYSITDHRADNLVVVRKNSIENYFYIFGGKDERSQDLIQGITLAGVFFDEVALMPESFVNQATGRCSVKGSKFWFNCNPDGPYHWFKVNWIDKSTGYLGKEQVEKIRQKAKAEGKDPGLKALLYLHFTMDDNLSLDEEVKARYRNMYIGVFFKRYILGLWAAAEGVIYDMFDEARHVRDIKDFFQLLIKWQALADDKLSEAEKLAKMTKEEKAQYMQQKREKELADREAAITRKELMAEAKNTLASDGLPQELAEVLDYSDADTCKKSMEKVKEVFQRAVETAVEEKLKGGKPPKKAPGGDAQKALEEQVYNIMMGNN